MVGGFKLEQNNNTSYGMSGYVVWMTYADPNVVSEFHEEYNDVLYCSTYFDLLILSSIQTSTVDYSEDDHHMSICGATNIRTAFPGAARPTCSCPVGN